MTGSDDRDPIARPTAEIEVPASPEDVWAAIATGEGNAAWLFAAQIEPRVGGDVTLHRAPFGPDAAAIVTGWDPPRHFSYEEPLPDRDGSGTTPLATEFLVEAQRGGSCVVRVVTSITGDSDGWEDVLEGATTGWRMSLRVLASYVANFAGLPAANLDVIVETGGLGSDRHSVFASLADHLGLGNQLGDGEKAAGRPFRTAAGAPAMAGEVEYSDPGYLLLRTSDPCPGLIAISTLPMDGVTLTVNVLGRLYGPDGPAVAERERDRWATWLTGLAARSV
jgi:uncharacterized protein YndB with AHSA1/START domain